MSEDEREIFDWMKKRFFSGNRYLDDAMIDYIFQISPPNDDTKEVNLEDFIQSLCSCDIMDVRVFLRELKNKKVLLQKRMHLSKQEEVKKSTSTPLQKPSQKKVHATFASNRTDTKTPRHKCDCVATKHKLINNCLGCGRIVCEQEGEGPCMFCKDVVLSPANWEHVRTNSADGKRIQSLYGLHDVAPTDASLVGISKVSNNAVEHRDRLLDYDINSTRRTKVYDDQTDYFHISDVHSDASDRWLDPEKKKELEQISKEMDRLKRQTEKRAGQGTEYQLDLHAGQLVATVKDSSQSFDGEAIRAKYRELLSRAGQLEGMDSDENEENREADADHKMSSSNTHGNETNGCVDDRVTLRYSPSVVRPPTAALQRRVDFGGKSESTAMMEADLRCAGRRDDGTVLSMHQPFASLLVAGMKRVEGRSWSTEHRGRLWIAATRREPSPEELATTLDFYAALRGPTAAALTNFPTGCVVGRVDVVDVLSADDFQRRRQLKMGVEADAVDEENYADWLSEENDSEFVWLCANARELLVKLPITGEPKLYRMSKQLHARCLASAVI